jgi:hypothetical protein
MIFLFIGEHKGFMDVPTFQFSTLYLIWARENDLAKTSFAQETYRQLFDLHDHR